MTENKICSDKRALIVNEDTGEPSIGMLLDEIDAVCDIEIHFTRAERRAAVAALIEAFVMANIASQCECATADAEVHSQFKARSNAEGIRTLNTGVHLHAERDSAQAECGATDGVLVECAVPPLLFVV